MRDMNIRDVLDKLDDIRGRNWRLHHGFRENDSEIVTISHWHMRQIHEDIAELGDLVRDLYTKYRDNVLFRKEDL